MSTPSLVRSARATGGSAATSTSWWRQTPRRYAAALPLHRCSCKGQQHRRIATKSTLPPLFDLNDSRPGPQKGDLAYLAMSGGVDSSVAALLAIQQGLQPSPLFMRNWNDLDEGEAFEPGAGGKEGCSWLEDWKRVKRTCVALGLKEEDAQLIDLSTQYWLSVFAPALEVWQRGETPNPDVACNREIKFGALLDRVLCGSASQSASGSFAVGEKAEYGRRPRKTWLVTGHYAGLIYSPDGYSAALRRARDKTKDQSYFLSSVSRSALSKVHLPLSQLEKSRVRELARKHRLPAAEQEESMGLCFVGTRRKQPRQGDNHDLARRMASRVHSTKLQERAFASFISSYLTPSPGPILSPDGTRLGSHAGLHTLTIGQRARLPGAKKAWFVSSKDVKTNSISVVAGQEHPALWAISVNVGAITWHASTQHKQISAQVRYRADAVPAKVTHDSDHISDQSSPFGSTCRVSFDRPILAVAPGQVCAMYDGDAVVGSGIIRSVETFGSAAAASTMARQEFHAHTAHGAESPSSSA